MLEDEIRTKLTETTEKSDHVLTPVGDISVSTNTISEDGIITSQTAKITKQNDILILNAELQNTNGTLSYDFNATVNRDLGQGWSSNASVKSNLDDSSVTLGIKKDLINPDNPMNTQNKDKVRKEELVESGERFSYQTTVGNNKENGFYTNNSLIYRIDNNNFLKSDYYASEHQRQITAAADLKKVKIDYTNTVENAENIKTTTNALNVITKGKKNQFTFGTNKVKRVSEGEATRNFNVDVGGSLNRTEYGEFQSGFNGAFNGEIGLTDGNVSNYNINLDGAYNYYGCEHNSTTDYMGRASISFGSHDEVKTFNANLSGAYRINNCNTIFEPSLSYTSQNDNGNTVKTVGGQFGIFQRTGKDVVVFGQIEGGKKFTDSGTDKYANIRLGADMQASKKLSFNANTAYNTSSKWRGEIGLRYNF